MLRITFYFKILFYGKLLSRLFDAVAPATIVERIKASQRKQGIASPPEHKSTNPIQRLVLPRLRYLNSLPTMKELRSDFDTALKAEQEATARMVAYHKIAARLRNLPAGARASETAIQNAKAAYGDDFVMPEGMTFVKDYEYGDPKVGEVVGYIAVKSTRAGSKDGKSRKGGKGDRNRKK